MCFLKSIETEKKIGIYVHGADILPYFSNIHINRPILNVLKNFEKSNTSSTQLFKFLSQTFTALELLFWPLEIRSKTREKFGNFSWMGISWGQLSRFSRPLSSNLVQLHVLGATKSNLGSSRVSRVVMVC